MSQTRFADSLSSPSLNYPYLMVRHSENAYKRYPIHFIRKTEKEFLTPSASTLVIAVDDTQIQADEFEVSRELIIDAARIHTLESKHPVCVVFDNDDCVFFDDKGRACYDDEPPFMGSRLEA